MLPKKKKKKDWNVVQCFFSLDAPEHGGGRRFSIFLLVAFLLGRLWTGAVALELFHAGILVDRSARRHAVGPVLSLPLLPPLWCRWGSPHPPLAVPS